MAYEQPHIIAVNEPFYSLEPLTDYLAKLDEVTQNPTPESMAAVAAADETLTSRAVLFPETAYVHGEGRRIMGYRSCAISDVVLAHARLAQCEPASPEYLKAYDESFRIPSEITIEWDDGLPTIEWHDSPVDPDRVRTDEGSIEVRRNAARATLISLGGHLAVSGAFIEREIEPAYEAIKASIENIGEKSPEKDFVSFGLNRISRDLLNRYWWVQHEGARSNPISKKEAIANIDAAWGVVGKPYGVFAKLVAAVASRPNF